MKIEDINKAVELKEGLEELKGHTDNLVQMLDNDFDYLTIKTKGNPSKSITIYADDYSDFIEKVTVQILKKMVDKMANINTEITSL